MKAMIFAAGLGTRLKPLTDNTPKALIKVNDKTLLQHAIEYLKKYGISEMVVNIHHFGSQIIDFIQANNFGVNISVSDETNELLDTGGGLKKASSYFSGNDPLVVVNADILTNVNIDKMLHEHIQSGNVATLAVRDRSSSRKLVFDKQQRLIGWRNLKTSETIEISQFNIDSNEYAFSGVQIISPKLFQHFPKQDKFSIIHWYLEIAKFSKIGAFLQPDGYWFDVGTIEKLEIAKQYLCNPK